MKAISIFAGLLFLSAAASAESLAYNIGGMHCGSCKAAVEKTVCKAPAASAYASCEVKLTDFEKEMGELLIETKPGQKADATTIVASIEKLGYKPELVTTAAKKNTK